MNKEMRNLEVFGFENYDKKMRHHPFLTKPVCVKSPSISDDYRWRCLARMKTIGANTGDLTRTPWEIVLFGDSGVIGDLPTTVKVPMKHLCKNENARKALAGLLPPGIELTFSEMIEKVLKNESTLLGMCVDFSHEIGFLTQHAEAMGMQLFTDNLVGQMPVSSQDDVKIEKVVQYLGKAKQTKLFVALGETPRRRFATPSLS